MPPASRMASYGRGAWPRCRGSALRRRWAGVDATTSCLLFTGTLHGCADEIRQMHRCRGRSPLDGRRLLDNTPRLAVCTARPWRTGESV
ncbi:hypothetical protein IG631_20489 [Alternaria alternata]|nr:hypothetical protein IG631_20489 [Alternaria alternata]